MKSLLRYFLIFVLFASYSYVSVAQSVRTHKVAKKETMYGISKMYGITVEQLVQANPGMEEPGYKLKKGSIINIPSADGQKVATLADHQNADADVRQRAIRVGVMLPLHQVNNDGRRMVEYYRGLLMACDSLMILPPPVATSSSVRCIHALSVSCLSLRRSTTVCW